MKAEPLGHAHEFGGTISVKGATAARAAVGPMIDDCVGIIAHHASIAPVTGLGPARPGLLAPFLRSVAGGFEDARGLVQNRMGKAMNALSPVLTQEYFMHCLEETADIGNTREWTLNDMVRTCVALEKPSSADEEQPMTFRMETTAMRSLGIAAALALFAAGPLARAEESPDLPPRALNAAKLAGLAGFVNLSCDKLRTDGERFKKAVQSMGVDPADLDRDALMLRARSYLAAYQRDVPGSCTRADELFGPAGRIIPGIFVPR